MATDRDYRQKQHHNARPVGRTLADGQRKRASGQKPAGQRAGGRRGARGIPGSASGTHTSGGSGTSGKRLRSGKKSSADSRAVRSGSVSGAAKGTAGRRNERKRRVVTAEERARQMKVLRLRLIIAGGILAAVLIWYAVMAGTYRNKYLPNTTINGYDVSESDPESIEEILRASVEDYTLELGFLGGKNETIPGSDIDLSYVTTGETEEILREQGRMGWLPSRLGRKNTYTVKTGFRFDQAKLRAVLEAMPEFQKQNITSPRDATIVRFANGTFHVATEFLGNEPDVTAVLNEVTAAVNASIGKLNIYTIEGTYKQPSVTSEDPDLIAKAEELNAFANQSVTIYRRDGNSTVIGKDLISSWVSYDETADNYYIDADAVYDSCYAQLQAIASEDNDINTTMTFKPRNYAEVTIPCPDYGYEIDVGDEALKLYNLLEGREGGEMTVENAISETIDPTFGGTYVEVDVTNQHVYLYREGELVYDTDCVTGKEYYFERRTPSGVFSILARDRDRTLGSLTALDPGQRYESHVDYWMPFFESYGMHDADWRDEENFGGEIYLSYGSHGCVNLPSSAAAEVFDIVETNEPLIVCREGDNAPPGTERGDVLFNAPEEGLVYE